MACRVSPGSSVIASSYSISFFLFTVGGPPRPVATAPSQKVGMNVTVPFLCGSLPGSCRDEVAMAWSWGALFYSKALGTACYVA